MLYTGNQLKAAARRNLLKYFVELATLLFPAVPMLTVNYFQTYGLVFFPLFCVIYFGFVLVVSSKIANKFS